MQLRKHLPIQTQGKSSLMLPPLLPRPAPCQEHLLFPTGLCASRVTQQALVGFIRRVCLSVLTAPPSTTGQWRCCRLSGREGGGTPRGVGGTGDKRCSVSFKEKSGFALQPTTYFKMRFLSFPSLPTLPAPDLVPPCRRRPLIHILLMQ